MSVRLNKVVRDLNVGIDTIVGFLQKKGIEVDPNPNAKINDEQYDMLVKEFAPDKSLKKESDHISLERQKRPTPVEKVAAPTPVAAPETAKPRVLRTIDLDKKPSTTQPAEQPKQETPAPVVEAKKEPAAQVKAEPVEKKPEPTPAPAPAPQPKKEEPKAEPTVQVKAEPVEKKPEPAPAPAPAPQPKKEEPKATPVVEAQKETAPATEEPKNEVFSLSNVAAAPKPQVLGRIDLDSINQQTRPKKKTKEERRKEREAKQPNANAATGAAQANGERKKRKRINKDRIDIEKTASTIGANPERKNNQSGNNNNNNNNNNNANAAKKNNKAGNKQPKRPIKAEVNEEDVQKQIKETLARLTQKNANKKGAKWRKEKREAFSSREQERAEQELADSKILKLTEFVTANDLASMMNVPINKVIGTCMSLGIMVSINQRLDAETINIVAEEFGFQTEYVSAEVSEAIAEEEDSPEELMQRPPIVTVMGHVDHGKTSLLDYIRNANVIAGEAGGITQHIGAYNVTLDDGRHITFLDTPGHEAFTAMRARGAKITDIAIIIVAADDNVMPQTIEAINHASAAGVPIVFAINKVDKPAANPDKIKESLAAMNYLVEEWGGKYQSQDISAKKGTGVDELLEKVLLEAEMLELKANPNRRAVGSIIESTLDKGRGYVATVLVQNGTLRMGDIVLAGTHHGRIKAMFNERNQRIQEAGPAEPVLILGLDGAPQAGDTFNVMETEQEAREIANKREQLQREQGLRTQKLLTLDDIGRRIAVGSFQELNIIVKGDVDGSVEALTDSLIKLSTEQIQVNVLHKAVGQISESDIILAAASNAIIVGFQVRPSMAARRLAEKEGVDVRMYSIIYDAIEQVKAAMEGMLAPEMREEIIGTAEVRETFHISKVGTIAGCIVKEGKLRRSARVRLIRDGIVIYTGELGSLKRFKDDVKEVVTGYECGLNITNYNDVKVGDLVEAYEEVAVKKNL